MRYDRTTSAVARGLNWVSVDQPDTHDFNQLRDTYHIKKKYIGYMRDIRERRALITILKQIAPLLIFRSVNQEKRGDSTEC